MNRCAALLTVLLISAGSSHAGELDPADLAEAMPGAPWKQVMKEFRKLDRDDDGLLSKTELRTPRDLYHIQDHAQESLPPKWTAGVDLIWKDNVMTKAEFWKLLSAVRSLPSGQRAAAQRSWLLLRKMLRNREEAQPVSSVVGVWAQSDPAGVAAWLQSLDRGNRAN